MGLEEDKLSRLIELEAISETDLFRYAIYSTNPGICMMPGCDYTTDVEPDQTNGWCESCDKRTVKSLSSLVGIV